MFILIAGLWFYFIAGFWMVFQTLSSAAPLSSFLIQGVLFFSRGSVSGSLFFRTVLVVRVCALCRCCNIGRLQYWTNAVPEKRLDCSSRRRLIVSRRSELETQLGHSVVSEFIFYYSFNFPAQWGIVYANAQIFSRELNSCLKSKHKGRWGNVDLFGFCLDGCAVWEEQAVTLS